MTSEAFPESVQILDFLLGEIEITKEQKVLQQLLQKQQAHEQLQHAQAQAQLKLQEAQALAQEQLLKSQEQEQQRMLQLQQQKEAQEKLRQQIDAQEQQKQQPQQEIQDEVQQSKQIQEDLHQTQQNTLQRKQSQQQIHENSIAVVSCRKEIVQEITVHPVALIGVSNAVSEEKDIDNALKNDDGSVVVDVSHESPTNNKDDSQTIASSKNTSSTCEERAASANTTIGICSPGDTGREQFVKSPPRTLSNNDLSYLSHARGLDKERRKVFPPTPLVFIPNSKDAYSEEQLTEVKKKLARESVKYAKLPSMKDSDIITTLRKDIQRIHQDKLLMQDRLGFTCLSKYSTFSVYNNAVRVMKELPNEISGDDEALREFLTAQRDTMLKEIFSMSSLNIIAEENNANRAKIAALERQLETSKNEIKSLYTKVEKIKHITNNTTKTNSTAIKPNTIPINNKNLINNKINTNRSSLGNNRAATTDKINNRTANTNTSPFSRSVSDNSIKRK